jgi:hypothetical protein
MPEPASYPVSDEHFRTIGEIVVIWSRIEMAMEVAICGLYEINPDRGLALTTNIGFQSRIALLRILAKRGAVTDRVVAGDLLKLLTRIEQGYAARNAAAHGVWSGTADPTVARRMSIRARGSRLACADDLVTVVELQRTADELDALRLDWSRLLVRLKLPSFNRATGE